MGVSGPKNFDDDTAHTYLYLLMEKLVSDIKDCFLAYDNGELDMYQGNSTLLPSIDILVTLSKHYGVFANLSKPTVQIWKKLYLQLYDSTIDKIGPRPSYKRERRKVIEETFTQLEEVCLYDADIDEANSIIN